MSDETKNVEDFNAAVNESSSLMGKLEKSIRNTVISKAAYIAKLNEAKKGTKAEADELKNLREAYETNLAVQEEESKITKEIIKQRNLAINSNKRHAKSMGSVSNALKKYTVILGATAFGLEKIISLQLSYDDAIFKSSRTLAAYGRSLGDLASAQKRVGEEASFSKEDFAQFHSAVISTHKGILPTTKAIENLAITLQHKFGGTVALATEALKEFMAIQNEFPRITKNATDALKEFDTGKIDASGLNDAKKQIMILGDQAGLTAKQLIHLSQVMTPPTAAEKKNRELKKSMEEMRQASEQLMLAIASHLAPVMIELAKHADKIGKKIVDVINSMKPWAPVIIPVVTALIALKLAIGGIKMTNDILGFSKWLGSLKGSKKILGSLTSALNINASAFKRHGGQISRPIGPSTRRMSKTIALLNKMKIAMLGVSTATGVAAGAAVLGVAAMAGLVAISIKLNNATKELKETTEDFKNQRTDMKDQFGVGSAEGLKKAREILQGGNQKEIDKLLSAYPKLIKYAKRNSQEEMKKLKTVIAVREAGDALILNYKKEVSYLRNIVKYEQERLNLANALGTMSAQGVEIAYAPMISALEQDMNRSQKFMQEFFGNTQQLFEQYGLDLEGTFDGIDMTKPFEVATKAIPKATQKLETEIDKLQQDRDVAEENGDKGAEDEANAAIAKRQKSMEQMRGQALEYERTRNSLIDARVEKDNAYSKRQEETNSIIESRLSTERQLMESAHFGMGASIDMMQKQVDLAYSKIKAENISAENHKKAIAEKVKAAGLSKEEEAAAIEGLVNAKDAASVQEIANRVGGKNTQIAGELVKRSEEHQKSQQKIMQSQQKVYDLTKEMREGYLDSIREMSSGAGEFEKIIGTQEMGFSQLIDTVKSITGEHTLSTMGSGGAQDRSTTAAGVGTNITGRYNAKGQLLKVLDARGDAADTEEKRNTRYYGNERSKQKHEEMASGEGGSEVGGALAWGEHSEGIRENTKEQVVLLRDIAEKGVKLRGGKISIDPMEAVNESQREGSTSRHGAREKKPLNAGSYFGANIIRNAGNHSQRANPQARASSSGELLASSTSSTPSITNASETAKEIAEKIAKEIAEVAEVVRINEAAREAAMVKAFGGAADNLEKAAKAQDKVTKRITLQTNKNSSVKEKTKARAGGAVKPNAVNPAPEEAAAPFNLFDHQFGGAAGQAAGQAAGPQAAANAPAWGSIERGKMLKGRLGGMKSRNKVGSTRLEGKGPKSRFSKSVSGFSGGSHSGFSGGSHSGFGGNRAEVTIRLEGGLAAKVDAGGDAAVSLENIGKRKN